VSTYKLKESHKCSTSWTTIR